MSKYVTVGAYNNPLEAHLAKGRLEVEGIPAYLAHEHHVWANWVYSQALGGVKVQVTEEHAGNAAKILDAHNKGEYEESLEEVVPDIDENICPKCGSKEFQSKFPIGMIILVLLTLGLVSVIFPPRREHHTCAQCGYKWRY
jgi:predicted nucleic-acid-binding Zn-ribbon protein